MSLSEILVSLLLLSILLLGLNAMQLNTLQLSRKAYYLSAATNQIHNMTDQIKNRDIQLETWNQENAELLPEGRGEIEGQSSNYIVTLCWNKTTCLKKIVNLA